MENILLFPSKTLSERVGNLFRGQQVSELDPANFVEEVWPEPPDRKYLHIIVRVPEQATAAPNQQDTATQQGQLYAKLVSSGYESLFRHSPSISGQPNKYITKMKPNGTGCAVFMYNRPIDYTSVPLALMFSGFGDFDDDFQKARPEDFDLKLMDAARELAHDMSGYFSDEDNRQESFNNWPQSHFGVSHSLSIGNYTSDGHVTCRVEGREHLVLIVESKNEDGGNSASPFMQDLFYYTAYYRKYENARVGRGLPAILITYQGEFANARQDLTADEDKVRMWMLSGFSCTATERCRQTDSPVVSNWMLIGAATTIETCSIDSSLP